MTTSPASSLVTTHVRTFLIADIRGYTQFTIERGDEAAARLAGRFAELATEIVSSFDGQVIELRGDEALAVFESSRQALHAALALQARFAQVHDASLPLRVGIGIDAGEAIAVDGGYRGAALNLAARLCSLAGPGEVLVSYAVTHLARKLKGVAYSDRGQVQLKGFADPVTVMEVMEERPPAADTTGAADQHDQRAAQELPIGGFLGSLPSGPLVGRETELAQVLEAVDVVATGVGRLVMLAGEPGAGKTRLAQEVTLNLRNRGFLVAMGRCYQPEQTVPYYPFLDAIAMIYAAAPSSLQRESARRWAYLGALLPDHMSVPGAAEGHGQDEQQRVFRAVTGFLEAVAESGPLAFLLDDLHWADSSSLKLLLHLARHTRTLPILLLGTYRDVEVDRQHPLAGALLDLHRDGLTERVDVGRLDEMGTAAFIATTMGEEEVSSEFAALVHGRTEGNPYFVQQVLRALVERGDVFRKEGMWDRRAIEEIEVPQSVRSVVGQRLGRLSEVAQEVLQEASILGQSFTFDDLLAISEPGERDVEYALEQAAHAGLIRDLGHDTYNFDHALTQQSIYGELSSRRKRRLHLAAAEALEHLPERSREAQAAEIAWHFLEGDDSERAVPWTMKAGDAAAAVFAYTDAELQYRTAAELARGVGDVETEAEALEKQGSMLYISGRCADALDPLEYAARLYQTLGKQERYLGVLNRIGSSHGLAGTAPAGIERLEPVIRELEASGTDGVPTGAVAGLYSALAQLYFMTGRWGEELSAAEAAIPLATQAGDRRILAQAEMQRGTALGNTYRSYEAQEAFEHAVQESEGVDDEAYILALYLYGLSHQNFGHLDEAEQLWRRLLSLPQLEAMGAHISFARMALSQLLIRRGRWREARAEAERAVEQVQDSEQSWVASYPLKALGRVLLLQGERELGLSHVERALAMAEQMDDFQGVAGSLGTLAWLDVREGRPQNAIDRLSPLRRRLEEQGFPADFPLEAEAWMSLGQEHRAAEIVASAKDLAEKGEAPLAMVEVFTVSAMLATRQGRREDATCDLEEGLRITREVGLPYDEALLLHEYGRMHAARVELQPARERFQAALAIFQRLGAEPDIERTKQQLTQIPLQHGLSS